MSQFCLLCGKDKPEKSLFCDDCKNKIEKEYEVDVPEGREGVPCGQNETAAADKPERSGNEVPEKDDLKIEEEDTPIPLTTRRKKNSIAGWLLVSGVLLVVSFFYYGQVVRKGNLDRSQWNMAVRENTIGGYLKYMQMFPKGKYSGLAEESLMKLKSSEADIWVRLQTSENTAELRDFISQFPGSPYNALVKRRLDSLTWMATLNDNTAESYSRYMVLSQSGEFSGDYFGEAQERHEMLFQSFPVTPTDLDSIQLVTNGFFSALSSINTAEMSKYLAPSVFRFFNSGSATREKIVGDLLISAAKKQTPTIQFIPNVSAIAYEKTLIEHYKVNVPLQKTYRDKDGQQKTVSGYIVQMELDRNFQIVTISESKSGSDAF